jgi:signal transduction histidine kinase
MHERAEMLAGQLTIESSPGKGARLTVELPVSAEPEPEGAPEAATEAKVSTRTYDPYSAGR